MHIHSPQSISDGGCPLPNSLLSESRDGARGLASGKSLTKISDLSIADACILSTWRQSRTCKRVRGTPSKAMLSLERLPPQSDF